ncbi:phage terminase large subunit [Endozoicomonas atrinae]|uniref:phage terminase large subunit n=1 Tax=Endozoicomonas atrinae TaxID=1333660 RepID=UPI000AAD4E29|nr:phage terminase large subunit [Endozoicomonas atrinae]
MAITWSPQPGPQTALLTCPIEDILYGGARGGGKTDGFLGKWLMRSQVYGGKCKGLFVRRSMPELDEVIGRSQEIFTPLGTLWKAQKSTWVMPNGAILRLRSLERDADAGKYQGHSYTDVYIDEGGNFPNPDPIDKLNATLRNPHGIPSSFNVSANPGGPGHEWIKKRYIDPAPLGMKPVIDGSSNAKRIYIPSRLEDNRLLMDGDPGYIARLKKSGPPWLVQAWLMGDWNATPEGGLIKAQWFKRYNVLPSEFLRVIQSWDTAYKPEQVNDPSVCTTWGETRHGWYLLDVFRERMEYPALKRAAASLYEAWRPQGVLIEDKGSGQSLIQELRQGVGVGQTKVRIPVIPIDTKGINKVDRLIAVSSLFEAGMVYLPEVSPWSLDYEIEMTIFPLAPHDDQVDSTSQFLKWAHENSASFDHAASGRKRVGMAAMDDGQSIQSNKGYGSVRGSNDFRGY